MWRRAGRARKTRGRGMSIRSVLAGAVAVVVMTAGIAAADGLEEWGSVGNWSVLIDPSLGNGCLIQSSFTDGSVVRIGFDRNEGKGYVTAFNEAWGDIEEGQTYDISFDLDGSQYDGQATGIYLNGVPGADIYFDSTDFLLDIAKKYTMTLYHDGAEVMSIDLTDSYNGLLAAIQCQNEQG